MSGFADLARAAAEARRSRPGVPLALATLVGVEGSSYRQPGARLLVDADGRVLAGAISGGCLEGDVAARAAGVCVRGVPETLTYDLRNDLEAIWGFGSACDGIATVLLEPLTADAAGTDWLAHADAVRLARRGGAVITHLAGDDRGSRGTVAVLDGSAINPVSGGARPFESQNETQHETLLRGAAVARRTGRAQVERTDAGTFFIDPLVAPIALNVIGAGRGAEAFARIGTTLRWEVVVADHREALLDALTLPAGVTSRVLRPEDTEPAALPCDNRTAIALLTHIFDTDLAWLTRLLPSPAPYIGVLGSRQRAAKLLERVGESIVCTPAMLQRVHAPIGLDLGGETPESIALAAIAEIEAVMHARPGGLLRERQSPIHERTPVPATDRSPRASVDSSVDTSALRCARPDGE